MLLVIGYGNSLRSDDAIGQQLTRALAERLPPGKFLTITTHQLTPELAEAISHASGVVFIDACEGDSPGAMLCDIVEPLAAKGAFTHNVTPASLLAAARDLYGAAPEGLLISVAGKSFDYGTELSLELSASFDSILERTLHLIEDIRETYHA